MSGPQQIAQVAEKGGATLAVSSGVAGWLVENHELLSSIGVCVGIVVGVLGLAISWYYQHKNSKKGRGA